MKANYCPECGKALRRERVAEDMEFFDCWSRSGCGKQWVLEHAMLSENELRPAPPSPDEKPEQEKPR